jgi:restriction endonuclease S subunit
MKTSHVELLLSDFYASDRWDPLSFFSSKSLPEPIYELKPLSCFFDERKSSLEPQKYLTTRFNYIGLENIESNTGFLLDFSPKYGEEVKSRSKVYRHGDVLYGRLRPTLNKFYMVDSVLQEGICSPEFFVLMPKNDVNPFYSAFILSSPWVKTRVENLVGGSTLPRLNIKDFMGIEVPCPPAEIQHEVGLLYEEKLKQYALLKTKIKDFDKEIDIDIIRKYLTDDFSEVGSLTTDMDFKNPLPIF